MISLSCRISVLALVISAGAALAADLPSKKSAPVAPAPAPLWTGFYVGLNGGYTWSNSNDLGVTTTSQNADGTPGNSVFWSAIAGAGNANFASRTGGFLGGGQFGYNYQTGHNFVIGLEADFQGMTGGSASGAALNANSGLFPRTGVPFGVTSGLSASRGLDYFGTVRGRVGYLVTPSLLAFATGGLAYGQIGLGGSQLAVTSVGAAAVGATGGAISTADTRLGWTLGGGLEWMVTPKWSVKAEYLYYDFGRITADIPMNSLGGGAAAAGTQNILASNTSARFDGHIVRLGLNYHFNYGFTSIATTSADADDGSSYAGSDLPSKKGGKSDQSYETGYFVPSITKIEAFGGALTQGWPDHVRGGQGGVIGSVIVPFNEHYAAQFDATVSGIYPGVSPGLAGHLYWADTKKGLLGLYGSGNFMTGADGGGNMQFGAEGAVFLDRFTIQGIAGVEGQSMDQASPGYSCQAVGNAGCYAAYDPKLGVGLYDAYGNPMPNVSRGLFQVPRVFDHVEFGYYATEDFKLYLAHEYTGGLHSGIAGAEYLLRTGNGIAPSIFVEGSLGERDTRSIIAGVRFYFGQEGDKSLMHRHREDDPTTHIRRNINTLANQNSTPGHADSYNGHPIPITPAYDSPFCPRCSFFSTNGG